ncbi:hypothetical protein ABZ070_24510 [Streptomyces sp. NPDC006283]|uniref:hypothetical protein n=1 Tax=Streptomyces sp. NPDC006283 TaxID=3156741 RepID=UPI0033B2EECB
MATATRSTRQLVGRRVELVFDPFDLTFLQVRVDGADAGTALPPDQSQQPSQGQARGPGRTAHHDVIVFLQAAG